MNSLLQTDSYKVSHFKQYPEGAEHVYSYIEPRKGTTRVVVLGITDFISRLDNLVTEGTVMELKEVADLHGVPFNPEWYDLLDEYKDKPLPVKVMGVPEGTVVTPSTPVAAIVNTNRKYPWLTSFLETMFLRCVWYPSTVASRSRYIKGRIKEYMTLTGADMSTLDFKLQDFGARGATSSESAAIGGMGHLTQFKGTDTLEAISYVRRVYGAPMAGFSIPATEHSTVTSWGQDNEKAMFESFIRKNGGEGKVFACVSDSYNIWEALKKWKELEPVLVETGGTLVVRPDSGDPVLTPVNVVEELLNLFGYTTNEAGFRVLPSYIRVIQGDGVDEKSIVRIMQRLYDKQISIDNIAFGMGGGLLQKLDRDTYGWAMKCSAIKVRNEWRDVFKDPIGGSKTSKKGLVTNEETISYAVGDHVIFTDEFNTDSWITYYDEQGAKPVDSWDDILQRASV